MSYNKLKSLVANVEAIETAMKIQVQGRQATAEEKEILSRYSGFGGIKEVLNIGTDKPIGGDMKEPIQRLQELINAYPHFVTVGLTTCHKKNLLCYTFTQLVALARIARLLLEHTVHSSHLIWR